MRDEGPVEVTQGLAGPRRRGRPKLPLPGIAAPNRRSQILAVATRRFAEFGFERTTVREIADDADILSGSIYHYFDTKEELLDAIIGQAVHANLKWSQAIAEAEADAETRFIALMISSLRQLEINREVQVILFHERKFFRRSERFAYVAEALQKNFVAWCEVLENGIDEKLFSADTNVFLTVAAITRLLSANADWRNVDEANYLAIWNVYSPDDIVDFEIRLVLRAIRVPKRQDLPISRKPAEALLKRLIVEA